MKTTTKFLPTWQLTLQISILSFLGVLLVLPHVNAEATIPATIPTSVEDLERNVPATPNADALLNQGREQAGRLIPAGSPDIPRTLEAALNSNNATTVASSAAQEATHDLSERLSGLGATNLNPNDLAQGNVSALASQIPDPQRLAETAAAVHSTYQDLLRQRESSAIHALWETGIQAPTDCASGNDDGKDLCSAIEDLKETIADVEAEVEAANRVAKQIEIYVTNKPAFLNTPSILTPVCLGLLFDGPGVEVIMPTIADDSDAYNSSENLVSQAAIKAKLLEPNTTASPSPSPTTSSDPLSATLGSSDRGAQTYATQVDTMQLNHDMMYLKGWQNFKTTMDERFKLTETRANEAEQFTDIVTKAMSALLLHPPTP